MKAGRTRLRRLVIDGRTYVWNVRHVHHEPPHPSGDGRCREVFTAYLEGRKATPLRIAFTDGAGRHAGYPERGVVWTSDDRDAANLNTPSVARRLIERARALGWQPETMRAPWVVDDGFALLE